MAFFEACTSQFNYNLVARIATINAYSKSDHNNFEYSAIAKHELSMCNLIYSLNEIFPIYHKIKPNNSHPCINLAKFQAAIVALQYICFISFSTSIK